MEIKLGSVPVRVHPTFLIVSAILGGSGRDPRQVCVWIVATFFSVLFHELGHAMVGRALGQTPSILLYQAGGLTTFAPGGKKLSTWGHIAISLAGPFAGFALGAAVYAVTRTSLLDDAGALPTLFVHDMLWVNFGWGILNLLPLLPLDGGNVARRLFLALRPGTADRNARVLSIVVAAAGAGWAALTGSWFLALYAVGLGGLNVQAIRAATAQASPADAQGH